MGFALLKTLYWETYLWVTLNDFTVKNPKLEKEIYFENLLSRKCAADNHNDMCHVSAKRWEL